MGGSGQDSGLTLRVRKTEKQCQEVDMVGPAVRKKQSKETAW